MATETLVALGVFVLAMLFQTGMMFYWGGQLTQQVRDHDRRIKKLES